MKGILRTTTLSVFQRRSLSSKVYTDPFKALEGLKDGMTVMFGGFGMCGIPENTIKAIETLGIRDIIAVSNDAGVDDFGLGVLVAKGRVSKIYASYLGELKAFSKLWQSGKIELELVPQGSLAEKMRAGGSGIPAYFTPTGYGTVRETGGFPVKYSPDGVPIKFSEPKETRVFNGRRYVMEESLTGDFGLIKAWKADTEGNCVFRATSRNFNPECAKSAKICVAEVEELVPAGTLTPDEIHLPGIYVQRILVNQKFEKRIAKHGHKEDATTCAKRDIIAKRAAKEFKDGMYANLGIGIPTNASNFIPEGINVVLQSENGLLGIGPYPPSDHQDADLINAGKEPITYAQGSSTFSSSDSFAMIRGQHVDVTMLGALQVSEHGDLSSWIIPNKSLKGFGGAMDLVAACKKVVVATMHTDKGSSKIMKNCTYPLTGKGVVDMIITELAVFECDRHHGGGLTLVEYAPGVTVEEIRANTDASFKVSPNLKQMDV